MMPESNLHSGACKAPRPVFASPACRFSIMPYGGSMQPALRYCATLAAAGSLVTSGCENFSATEAGLLAAGLAGAATGIALGTTGVPASSSIPIALGAAAARARSPWPRPTCKSAATSACWPNNADKCSSNKPANAARRTSPLRACRHHLAPADRRRTARHDFRHRFR